MTPYIRLTSTLLGLLAMTACTRTIDIDSKYVQNRPTLNAILLVDAQHPTSIGQIQLSRTATIGTTPIDPTSLTYTVNGNPIVLNRQTTAHDHQVRIYEGRANLRTGDKIELKAEIAGTKEVLSAQTSVPRLPQAFSVEQGEYTSLSVGDMRLGYMPITIKITDTPDEANYYRLVLSIEREEYSGTYFQSHDKFNHMHDYIMTDGNPSVGTDEYNDLEIDLSNGLKENVYHVFDDRFFEGKEGKITLRDYWVQNYYTPSNRPYNRSRYYIGIEAITPEVYHYYRALATMRDHVDNPLVTPTKLPSNVHGGTGIVGVRHRGQIVTITLQ